MSDCIIETKGLTKRYGEQVSVSTLDLHVQKGRIYGLLGRNGAGKTTTMKMLLGLTAPTSGTVSIFGRPLKGNEKRVLPRIGSLIESPGFYPNLTGTENLQIFARLRGLKSPNYIKGALELVNLPYRDKKRYAQYSLGMKQRLAIALSVMHDPELLILDEPINGLDPQGIAEVRETLYHLNRDRNITLILASHILEELAKIATHYGILHDGALLQELTRQELLEKCGERIELQTSDTRRACTVLEGLGITQYKVVDRDTICIYERLHDGGAITMALAQAGVQTTGITVQNEALEDYYLNLTGGGRHA